MATAIDPSELQELSDLCAENGIYLPANIKTAEELIRCLLIGHKTKAAVRAQQKEREDHERLAEQRDRDGNPDRPSAGDDDELVKRIAGALQMSTGGDVPNRLPVNEAERAKILCDLYERFRKNPNHARNPFA